MLAKVLSIIASSCFGIDRSASVNSNQMVGVKRLIMSLFYGIMLLL